jgi:hypothetical protein
MLKYLAFLLLILPASLFAQNTIMGKILSLVNKKPVPDASVFLSNASVGGKSADDGSFTLSNVKNGQYDLVVSCVGYETHHQTVFVNNSNISIAEIALMPKVTELKEVKVRYDAEHDRHLQQFITEFVGRSANARDCKILNPEIVDLDFEKATGKLTASTDDFLIIENKALGYRIKYLLQSFSLEPKRGYVSFYGSPMFENLAGKAGQLKRWQKKRMEVYLGSDMHFLRTCIINQVDEQGFRVLRLIRQPNPQRPADSIIKAKLKQFKPAVANGTVTINDSLSYWSRMSNQPKTIQTLVTKPLNTSEYVKRTDTKGIFALSFPDCLNITYKKDADNDSILTFYKQYVFFDSNGVFIEPGSTTLEGKWATMRIAELLPVDYEVPEK